MQKRAIASVASSAIYEDKVGSEFIEGISDFLSDVSDNQAHKMDSFCL